MDYKIMIYIVMKIEELDLCKIKSCSMFLNGGYFSHERVDIPLNLARSPGKWVMMSSGAENMKYGVWLSKKWSHEAP